MLPRLCGIDIETTGLDHGKDYVTEIAWVIKDAESLKPLVTKSWFCQLPDGVEISQEIYELTKITSGHCAAGYPFAVVIQELCADLAIFKVDYIVAHNGENFDKPFLEAKIGTETMLSLVPWLDTQFDIVYPRDCRANNLLYVAAYFGFVNPFPHSALFDVMTMFKVLSHYPIEQVIERAKSPWIVIQSLTSYENRHLPKARRYFWETLGTTTYPKQWVKKIKECELEKEIAESPFKIEVLR